MKPFSKINFILIAVSVFLIVLGFVLMGGEVNDSTEVFNQDIFSVFRLTIGPMISLFGFVFMIVGIMMKKK